MTRKHFTGIAHAIDNMNLPPKTKRIVAEDMADALRPMNPNFDRSRFLKACGVEA